MYTQQTIHNIAPAPQPEPQRPEQLRSFSAQLLAAGVEAELSQLVAEILALRPNTTDLSELDLLHRAWLQTLSGKS